MIYRGECDNFHLVEFAKYLYPKGEKTNHPVIQFSLQSFPLTRQLKPCEEIKAVEMVLYQRIDFSVFLDCGVSSNELLLGFAHATFH